MLAGVMQNDPHASSQEPALVRHNAVSWIEQALTQGHTLGRALALASELAWGGAHYSPRTLEGWLYEYRAAGFTALVRRSRSDKGELRALSPEAAQAILHLRRSQPALPVTSLVRQLLTQAVLEPGTFSMPSVYRLLRREGLDRPQLVAQAHGPTKAFECELPNTLWMSDIMDGPALRLGQRVLRTFLFATLDDCSRLVPHAQYYENEKLRCLLDCLQQAFACRGLPEKLYTDQGKIFTGSHLRLVCANLQIRLLHARPYAAWSKGKIERFFQTVQRDFEARLRLDPVQDLHALNNRFWSWLESEYHRRAHTALGGASPAEVFARKSTGLRQLPLDTDWVRLFLARATRRVRLDATVSLEATLWEVPVHLRGREVELRYDPFAWSRVEVWYRDGFVALARRCDKHLNAKTYTAADYER
jgi:transposase InsO family protein